jgi:hypothetical protein
MTNSLLNFVTVLLLPEGDRQIPKVLIDSKTSTLETTPSIIQQAGALQPSLTIRCFMLPPTRFTPWRSCLTHDEQDCLTNDVSH